MQKINLFISYFQCGDDDRQKELDFCLEHNKKSGLFHSIINFDKRPMYSDFFQRTKEHNECINVFANADIYFNDTINLVRLMSKNEAYALTRWEESDDGIISFEEKHTYNKEAKARHSQDVWVFNGSVDKYIYGDFHIGVAGCDNRIAYEIERAGYKLSNPSDVIQCIHKHKEESRNYNVPAGYKNGKVSPPYKWVNVGRGVEAPKRKGI